MALKEIKSTLGKTILTYDDGQKTVQEAIREALDSGIDFSYADFYRMDLSGTDFHGANLFSSNFREATANTCNFRETNLNNSNFDKGVACECDFYGSSARMSSFFRTKLDKCVFAMTDLSNSDFLEASLRKSVFCGCPLSGVKNIPVFIPTYLPEGDFIGWVKVIGENENYIIKIKVLNDSKRTRGMGDICRCDKALVLSIQDLEGNELDVEEIEYHDRTGTMVFRKQEVVECEHWYPGRWDDCQSGITFFIDRQSAMLYE
jgi:hypothetical protein